MCFSPGQDRERSYRWWTKLSNPIGPRENRDLLAPKGPQKGPLLGPKNIGKSCSSSFGPQRAPFDETTRVFPLFQTLPTFWAERFGILEFWFLAIWGPRVLQALSTFFSGPHVHGLAKSYLILSVNRSESIK